MMSCTARARSPPPSCAGSLRASARGSNDVFVIRRWYDRELLKASAESRRRAHAAPSHRKISTLFLRAATRAATPAPVPASLRCCAPTGAAVCGCGDHCSRAGTLTAAAGAGGGLLRPLLCRSAPLLSCPAPALRLALPPTAAHAGALPPWPRTGGLTSLRTAQRGERRSRSREEATARTRRRMQQGDGTHTRIGTRLRCSPSPL